MSTGEMKISDILEYSIKIEHESMNFYRSASAVVAGQAMKELLVLLELEEVMHEKKLTDILANIDETAIEGLDPDSLDDLIQTGEITAESTEKDILETALNREENTRDFYARISTMTNLSAEVIDLFQMLYTQESGHVIKVGNMLNKIGG